MQAIVVQTFIAAPAATAWAALRDRTGLLFDGLPAKGWPSFDAAQEPVHFESAWPFTPAPTRVSITLHDVGGGVRVDVRHDGWGEGGAWDDAIQGHFAGWLQGLAALGLWLETGVDARPGAGGGRLAADGQRYFISGEIPANPEAVYRSLTDGDVLGRWGGDSLGAAPVAEQVENRFIRWKGDSEVTAILRPTPRGTHLAIAEYGVRDQRASQRWPAVFEKLAQFLG